MLPKKLSFPGYVYGKVYRFTNRYVWRYLLNRKLKQYFKSISGKEGDWWEKEYMHQFHHHSFQNKIISTDFIQNARKNKGFVELFSKSTNFAELGAGTGELAHFLNKAFPFKKSAGFEVSETAVGIANELYGGQKLKFYSISTEDMLDGYGKFDFVICSNTLEHFKNPFPIIEKGLNLSEIFIAIVPYKQPPSSQYSYEGGPDHVFMFDEKSFIGYQVVDHFVFRTGGWQVSSAGEEPLEMAIILKK